MGAIIETRLGVCVTVVPPAVSVMVVVTSTERGMVTWFTSTIYVPEHKPVEATRSVSTAIQVLPKIFEHLKPLLKANISVNVSNILTLWGGGQTELTQGNTQPQSPQELN